MLSDATTPDAAAIEQELERIVQSKVFAASRRSQEFLRYVVQRSLADPHNPPKEFAIAMDVFGRGASYDPAIDATVRVEAGRLRGRLREYYAEEGEGDPVSIAVPKGGYAAAFGLRHAPLAAGSPASASSPSGASRPDERRPEDRRLAGRRSSDRVGIGRRARWGVLSMVCLLAALALVVVWGRRPGASSPRHEAQAEARISLAILPFTNETGDTSIAYMADGLTDNLIRQLAQISRLKVMARGTVFHYQSSSQDASAIGRTLKVSTVLTGEIRRAEGKLEVDTELTDARDGSVIASRQYLPEHDDLLPVQASILRDLMRWLRIEEDARLPASSLRPLTASRAAFDAYLRGESAARDTSEAGLQAAIQHFEQAVRLDPNFALAWSDLGAAHLLIALYYDDPRRHMPEASRDATRALALDSTLREAHGTLGLVHLVYDWDYPAALAELSSGQNEESAIGELSCTAHLLELTGSTRSADELVHRMLGYDPQSPSLTAELGCIDYYRADYSGAIRHYREALASDPQSAVAYWGLGKSLSLEGKFSESVAALRQFRPANGFEPPIITAELGYALGRAGARAAAVQEIAVLKNEDTKIYVDPYLVATIYLGMGDRRHAYEWLDRAQVVRSPFLTAITTEPKWRTERDTPAMRALLAKMTPRRDARA